MKFEEFKDKAKAGEPAPEGLAEPLVGLWNDAAGNWKKAHEVVQEAQGPDAAWVHAYLHRKEGDLGNARYWYRRASRPEFSGSLAEEWEHIVRELL